MVNGMGHFAGPLKATIQLHIAHNAGSTGAINAESRQGF